MRNFFCLLKVFMKQQYTVAEGEKKKRIPMIILMAFSFVFINVMFTYMTFSVGKASVLMFGQTGVDIRSEIMSVILMIGMALILLLSIVSMLSFLFLNTDTEFLATLPMSPSTIFAAKVVFLYVQEIIMTATFLFIPIIGFGIAAGLSVPFYICALLSMLIVPAIPMFVSSILCVPLMYLASFFKNRGVIGSIAILLVFVGLMGAYIGLIMGVTQGVGSDGGFETIAQILIDAQLKIRTVSSVFLPIYAISTLGAGVSFFGLSGVGAVFAQLASAILIPSVLFAIAMLISRFMYRRAIVAQQEQRKKEIKKEGTYKSSSSIKNLVKNDFKNIMRNSSFAINIFINIVMVPLMVVIFGVILKQVDFTEGSVNAEEILQMNEMATSVFFGVVCAIVLMLGGGLNPASISAFSRDGQVVTLLHTMPVDIKTIVRSKMIVSSIISALSLVLGFGLIPIFFEMRWEIYIPSIVLSTVYSIFINCFGIHRDMARPKLNWKTPVEVFKKRGGNTVANILILYVTGFVGMIGVILALVLPMLLAGTGVIIALVIWIIMIGGTVGLAVWQWLSLFRNCERLWREMEA